LPVDPDYRVPVHRPEVEQNLLLLVTLDREGTTIPQSIRITDALADAAERRFDRERHKDLAVELLGPFVVFWPDGVIPGAVEVLPVLADELWPRILGMHLV